MENQLKDKSQKVSKWLRRLQRESWQAELLVSGIALFGSLQLPGLTGDILDFLVNIISEKYNFFLAMLTIYLTMGAYILIITFISHFVLRALWIGLIGVNSVYPQGINLESDAQSRDFLEKAKKDFPEEEGRERVRNLDKICSVLFGFAAQMAMTFLAISIDLAILGGLYFLLDWLLGATVAHLLGKIILVVFTVYLLVNALLGIKKIREQAWARKIDYPLYFIANKAMMHIFYKPTMYLMLTYQTNNNHKILMGGVMAFSLVTGMFMGRNMNNSSYDVVMSHLSRADNNQRTDRIFSENYLDTRTDEYGRIVSPILESQNIDKPIIDVFVPILFHERMYLDSLCGGYETPDSLNLIAKRQFRHQYYTDCHPHYLKFFANDSLLTEVDMIKYEHPHSGENGVLVKLPARDFNLGKNVVSIEKSSGVKGVRRKKYNIVFWRTE